MIVDRLYPYQHAAAERIAAQRLVLLADQPGLGKTYTALGGLELGNALTDPKSRVLILSPLIACGPAWFNTCTLTLPDVVVVNGFSGSRAARERRIREAFEQQSKPVVVVTNHESIGVSSKLTPHVPSLHGVPFAAIVIDESHMVLPRDYDTTHGATEFWRGLEAILEVAPDDQIRVAVSGTPDRGKLWNRFGTWKFLLPKVMRPPTLSYDNWVSTYFRTYQIKVPVRRRDGREFTATVRKIGNLFRVDEWLAMDRRFVIRRTKAEVAQQLPAKQYVDVSLPMPRQLLSRYDAYKQQFENTDKKDVYSALTFAMRSAHFAIAEWEETDSDDVQMRPIVGSVSPKRDWILQWLQARGYVSGDEYDAGGGQVVIACEWVAVLEWLHIELMNAGITAALLTGKTPATARRRVQDDFQAGKIRVVLLSSTLGVGIDLDAADDLIFVSTPRSPDVQEQTEDRVHRVSRNHQVTIWRLRSIGTIDDAIRAANDDVFQKSRQLLDGYRDVDFERRVIARIGE